MADLFELVAGVRVLVCEAVSLQLRGTSKPDVPGCSCKAFLRYCAGTSATDQRY
jgi:hypothetical protein